ncbi:AAA family ATPase [Streptomyces sp. NPDC090445]|uniref:AAA family ATPase n=1 Tax=Streptomyces sp. NPDC090445 TaxID=3365963 RepID=UPI00382AF932
MIINRENRLGRSVSAARDRAFVGRTAEQQVFRSALAGDRHTASVLFLHGPGGIGKSALLRRFASEARAAGRTVVEVSGRTVSPEPAGMERSVAAVVNEPGAVLLFDTFERFQGIEGWLCGELGRLPGESVVVIAGRSAPGPCWSAAEVWSRRLQVLPLRELPRDEAAALLRLRGVDVPAHDAVLAFTGGNPLALALAAAVVTKAEEKEEAGQLPLSPGWPPGPGVIAALLAQLVGDPPSPAHRSALEVCARAHLTSEELMRAVLGESADDLFDWLRAQPYVESTAAGLYPHDVVRDALESDLRWRDPEGSAELHHLMHRHLLRRVREVPAAQMLHAVGALQYLYRTDGYMTDFHRWYAESLVVDQPCTPADEERVVELVGASEGAESAEIARYWLAHRPECFRVQRSLQSNRVVGCSAWLRLTGEDGDGVDPVASAAWAHVRAHGALRPGEHIALARFHVYPPSYQRPSSVMDLVLWRMLGEIIRADRLGWSFIVMRDDGFWDDHLLHCDMAPGDVAPLVDGHPYRLFSHDWRTQPVTSWLTDKSEQMLTGSGGGTSASPGESPPSGGVRLFSRSEFDAAVRGALSALRTTDGLSADPLQRSRIVRETGRGLHEVLLDSIDGLANGRNGEKYRRAARAEYTGAAPTQEAAARRLGLPYSTYRRHLKTAVDRICDSLWSQELGGAPTGSP